MRPLPLLLLPLLGLAIGQRTGRAHGRAPAMSSIAVQPGDPRVLVAGTTFGALLSKDGGESWGWICEEAIGYEGTRFDARLQLTPEGHLVALGAGEGLRLSRDDGCTWTTPEGITGLGLEDLTISGSPPGTIWATTSRYEGANALLVSNDGGASFRSTSLSFVGRFLSSVRVLSGDPLRLRVAAWWFDPAQSWLLASDDGGASWTERALAGSGDPLYLLSGDPLDADRLWLRTNGSPYNSVLRARADGSDLVPVLRVASEVRAMVISPDGQQLWVSTTDAIYLSEDRGAQFHRLDHPLDHACVALSGTEILACGTRQLDGWNAAASGDGGRSWRPLLDFTRVAGTVSCPAGAPSRVCESYWPLLAAQIGADPGRGPVAMPVDAGPGPAASAPNPAKGGCGYATGRPDLMQLAWGALALLALAVRWKRDPV